jgi:hypothetical protein
MHAPSPWAYEVMSALGKAVHFGLVTAEEGERALGLGQLMGVRIAPRGSGRLVGARAFAGSRIG